jgi:hypothetical protein
MHKLEALEKRLKPMSVIFASDFGSMSMLERKWVFLTEMNAHMHTRIWMHTHAHCWTRS